MELDLKIEPCPFCGSGAYLRDKRDANKELKFSISCTNISCSGHPRTTYMSNEEDVISSWNMRFDSKIVHCKDCKNYKYIEKYGLTMCVKLDGANIMNPNDFCSYAEGKDNGADAERDERINGTLPNEAFCFNCDDGYPYIVDVHPEEVAVRGVTFTYPEHTAYCTNCGEEVYVSLVNDTNVDLRANAYRNKMMEKCR